MPTRWRKRRQSDLRLHFEGLALVYDRAVVGLHQAIEAADQGALTGPARADDDEPFAARDLEIHLMESAVQTELFHQADCAYQRLISGWRVHDVRDANFTKAASNRTSASTSCCFRLSTRSLS